MTIYIELHAGLEVLGSGPGGKRPLHALDRPVSTLPSARRGADYSPLTQSGPRRAADIRVRATLILGDAGVDLNVEVSR